MTAPQRQLRIPTSLGDLAVTTQGTGPMAVLWHSLFVDDRSWDRVAHRLGEHRTLVRITGPGHGRSVPRTTAFDLEDCATAAFDVVDALDPCGTIDMVGNAWGGHVGMVAAARDPVRVRTLVTFNSPVRALTAAEARGPRLAARILSLIGAVRPVRDGVANAMLPRSPTGEAPDLRAYLDECLRTADRRALANAIRSISLGRPDLTPLLPRVRARTVLAVGADDELWTPDAAKSAAKRMPNATVRIVAGSAHLTPLERPDDAASIILDAWGVAT